MENVALIGIDLGKPLFTFTVKTSSARLFFARSSTGQSSSNPSQLFLVCTIVMEACAGAHYMARRLAGSGMSKLIFPQFVRPFVKSNKNDFIDAENYLRGAACRPSMRFVTPKTESQQTLEHCIVCANRLCAIGLRHRTRYTAFYSNLASVCRRSCRHQAPAFCDG